MTTPKSVTASVSRRKPSAERTFYSRKQALTDQIVPIVRELHQYWPLTVRQVYYQAVARHIVKNNKARYNDIIEILGMYRKKGIIPWEAIEDRSRYTIEKRGVPDWQTFIRDQLKYFANPAAYGRCYVSGQTVYVEVSVEKDALSSVIGDAVWMKCTRVDIVRGQASGDIVYKMAERFKAAIMQGQKPILMHFGDLDPSGVSIPKAMKRSFLEDHGIDVDVRRVALTPEQVEHYRLPEDFDAAKKNDPNYKTWIEEYGECQAAVELDALHPKDLADIATKALEDTYDADFMDENKAIEAEERQKIQRYRDRIMQVTYEEFPEIFGGNAA